MVNTFIRHFLIAGLGLYSGLAHVKLTLDKLAIGQTSLRILLFFPLISKISLMFHLKQILYERYSIILAIDNVFKLTLEDRVLTEKVIIT